MKNDEVEITLPTELKWVPVATRFVETYTQVSGMNERLSGMVVSSVDEACGKLLERAAEAGGKGEFCISITSDELALNVMITYDAGIPLNPHREKPYEVPSADTCPADIDVDNMWLYMIKYRMDRVYFKINGKRQTLHLTKYFREKGKEKQVWVLGLKPALKKELYLDYSPQTGGRFCRFIQNFQNGCLLRLGEAEMAAVQSFDGKTKVYDIYMKAVADGFAVTPVLYINLYEQLEHNRMLDQKTDNKSSFFGKYQDFLERLTFALPHSDRWAELFYRMFRPMFTRAGMWMVLLVALSALVPFVSSYHNFTGMYANAYRVTKNHWWVLPVFIVLYNLTMMVHELCHAAVCKKYGGTVPRIGITYYLVSFIFFCDTSSSYNFRSKWQRVAVSLGGPISTLLLGCIFCWGFYLSTDDTWRLLFGMLTLSCCFSLLMNFNPFIRMDAYYMMSDCLGINNLRPLAFKFVGNKLKRLVGMETVHIDCPKEKNVWLWFYGISGSVVTVLFIMRPFARFVRYMSQGVHLSAGLFWSIFFLLLACANLAHRLSLGITKFRSAEYKIK